MKLIAVIGAGTMGNGIAHTFAQFGYQVALIDVSEAALERAIQTIGVKHSCIGYAIDVVFKNCI